MRKPYWLTLTLFAVAMAAAPVLADSTPAALASHPPVTLKMPLPAPDPATANAGKVDLQDHGVLTASIPFQARWRSSISNDCQSLGRQTSRRRVATPLGMALAGAAIGAIVGAVDGEPLRDAAIGGGAGLGLGFVMRF